MELVYLWVEKYKNIHNQGFNFSPRFECEYDKDTNELTINENDDYIENFFGDNINVTAIVGKNGSGKSSINKLILLLLFCKNFTLKKETEQNPKFNSYILKAIRPFVNKDLFLIIYDDGYKKISIKVFIRYLCDTFTCEELLSRKTKDIDKCSLNHNGEIIPEIEVEESKSFFIHFNYMLDTLYDGEKDEWIKEIYHKSDNYTIPLLLEPYKNNNEKEVIDLELLEYLNNQNLLRFYSDFLSNKKVTQFFNPNKIKFFNRNFTFQNNVTDEEFTCIKEPIFHKVANKFWKIIKYKQVFLDIEEFDGNFCKIMKQIESWHDDKNYKSINLLYISLKVKLSNEDLFNQKEYEKYEKWLLNLEENNYDITPPSIDYDNLIADKAPDYEVRKIKACINFDESKIYDNNLFISNLNKKVAIKNINSILSFIPPWVSIEFFEDEKSIKSLSSGEKSFFTFLINVSYQVKNINDRDEYETIYLFLDEVELGLHPQWQKEYLNNLLFSLEQINNKKIHLIFATHSPFILSDLPKENVIFLDTFDKKETKTKYLKLDTKDLENGNCINVSKHIDINPFGANIHTLLSDGFFMEGGLMGEFAKGKINEIIEFYNKIKDENPTSKEYNDVKKEFHFIHKQIGEEYLKGIIGNHIEFIEDKLGDKSFKERRRDKLQEELAKINEELKNDND